MGVGTAVAIGTALLEGIPKLIAAIKAGRNPEDIKLSEFISTDAVDKIKGAINKAQDFKDRFPDDPDDS